MSDHNRKIGMWGEQMAANYLEARGLAVVGRNIRTAYGEIDLVAMDGDELVFVEVKTRTNLGCGEPEEAVTKRKLGHLMQSVEAYLQELEVMPENVRIDVVAILRKSDQLFDVEWFKNALV